MDRMGYKNRHIRIDIVLFLLVVIAYLAGQILIGTYSPDDGSWHFDAPADIDFLYYAGITQQMKHSFPPQNPAFGGVPLSQSFMQYYPTVLFSYLVNPYLAMKIFNLIYLVLLAYIFKRYFGAGWGVGLTVVAAGSVGFGLLNSLGIDLIARGFNHGPFFIALTVALFEKKRSWLRWLCLFFLGWLHSYSALLAVLFFGLVFLYDRCRRESLINLVVSAVGLATASMLTFGVADKPFYFPFVEGFGPDLTHLWPHALAAAILVIPAKNARIFILFAIAFVFGLFFHYNPFFPVFLLYFSAGWAAAEMYASKFTNRIYPVAVTILLFVGFVIGAIGKYDPRDGNYLPTIDRAYAAAGQWLEENTPPEAVIVTLPLEPGWTCRLMEKRALYLGFIPHVAHLGIDWQNRAQKLAQYFANPPVYLSESEYVIYGPAERRLFSTFELGGDSAYEDKYVTIWKLGK